MSQGQGGGRPRKFETPKEIDQMADAYFLDAETKKEPFTITGLAMALGTSRSVLCDYENGKFDTETEKFSEAIKWQKLRVENYAEKQLYLSPKVAGPIFHLSNMGWSNNQRSTKQGSQGVAEPMIVHFSSTDEML